MDLLTCSKTRFLSHPVMTFFQLAIAPLKLDSVSTKSPQTQTYSGRSFPVIELICLTHLRLISISLLQFGGAIAKPSVWVYTIYENIYKHMTSQDMQGTFYLLTIHENTKLGVSSNDESVTIHTSSFFLVGGALFIFAFSTNSLTF